MKSSRIPPSTPPPLSPEEKAAALAPAVSEESRPLPAASPAREVDRQDALLESFSEAKRWDPVPGSSGHQVPEAPSEDEDEEGRSETEQRVDDGMTAAARDTVRQSARDVAQEDRREQNTP
ncbi:MAG: hypothetical protein HZA32_00700 [Opitutae bacterium]|nr:hypothetical protein [Opitutae bacterium]